jgi:hypothetical protein
MASLITDLETGVIDAALQGAVEKFAQNLATKGDIAPAQVPIIVSGVLDAVTGVFKLYKQDSASSS